MSKITYSIGLLNLRLPFILGKNKKERKNFSVKKIPKITIGQIIDGHKVREVHKIRDQFSFTCSTCNGSVAHPFDGCKFDVYKKIPPPK